MFNIFIYTALIIMVLMLIFNCGIAIFMATIETKEKYIYKKNLKEENEKLKEEIRKLKS